MEWPHLLVGWIGIRLSFLSIEVREKFQGSTVIQLHSCLDREVVFSELTFDLLEREGSRKFEHCRKFKSLSKLCERPPNK